jgi:serine/threonine protein kinase/tetratricopeptide (TPR) repeat protein
VELTRYLRLKWVLLEAAEKPSGERTGYLQRTCGDDAELEAEVRRLLENHDLDTLSAEEILQRALGDPLTLETLGGDAGTLTVASPGETLGHYRILEKIGEGGMGLVCRAVDTKLDREVAIKFMPALWTADPQHLERFRREARTVAALNHPNIIVVHDIEEGGSTPFIVMELVRGRTLRQLIPSDGLLLRQLLDYAIPIADALAAAHSSGVTHADLKPENVMVTMDGRAKVLDFGIARRRPTPAARADAGEGGRGGLAGTPAYMSPEQLRGEEADPQSDVFSFGVLLYEMAAGRRPFEGDTLARLLRALEGEPAPLTDRADLPASFEAIVSRCLARSRSARPKTMAPVLDELLVLRRDLERDAMKGLVARSQQATDPALSVSGASPVARPRAVAVLPLQNLSTDPEQGHFCVGLTEEIASELSRVPDLRVSVASRLDRAAVDPLEMGRLLGVAAVVDGSVRRAGDQMRITVRLVSVSDGTQLWSSRFERSAGDVFAVQDEVAAAVAHAFDVELGPGHRPTRAPNPRAYAAYLRGRSFWGRRYEDGLRRALDCFAEALAIDPEMAEAHAGAADCYVLLGHYGYMPPAETYPRAREGAERALALVPELAEAHCTMGWIQAFFDWRWDAAEKSFERALTLDPNYATAWEWNGIRLVSQGRRDEGLRSMRQAWRLDPLSLMVGSILGWACYEAGEREESDRILTTVIGMDPRFVFAQNVRGALVAAGGGDAQAGVDTLERAVALSGREGLALAFLGFAYGRAGRLDDALGVVEELKGAGAGSASSYHLALPFVGAGRTAEALDHLETAVERRESFFTTTHFSVLLDGVRQDPRFAVLVERMRL